MGKQIHLDIAKRFLLLEGLRSKLESDESLGVFELLL